MKRTVLLFASIAALGACNDGDDKLKIVDDEERRAHDPEGRRIVCSGSDVTVISNGPDKKEGTSDDIRSK